MPEGRWTRIARRSAWPQCTARWAGRTGRSPHASARTARRSGCGWPTSARGHLRHPLAEEPWPARKNAAQGAPEDHGGGAQGAAGGRLRRQLPDVKAAVPVRQEKVEHGLTYAGLKGLQGGGPAQQDPAPRAPPCGKPGERIAAGGRRRRSWRRAARGARGRDPCDGGRHDADVRRAPDGAAQGIPRRRAAVSNGLDAGGPSRPCGGKRGRKPSAPASACSETTARAGRRCTQGAFARSATQARAPRGATTTRRGDSKAVQGPEDLRRRVHRAVPDPLQRRKNARGDRRPAAMEATGACFEHPGKWLAIIRNAADYNNAARPGARKPAGETSPLQSGFQARLPQPQRRAS